MGARRPPGEFQISGVVGCQLVPFSQSQDRSKGAFSRLRVYCCAKRTELLGILKKFFAGDRLPTERLDGSIRNLRWQICCMHFGFVGVWRLDSLNRGRVENKELKRRASSISSRTVAPPDSCL